MRMIDREEYEKLREEWDKGRERFSAYREYDHCFNCGSTESVEIHHIVALKCGGTNNPSNIVALCHRCHCAAHHSRHIRDYCNKKITGRPHKVSKDVLNTALDDYLKCRIGAKECKERMKLSPKCKIRDMSFFKRLLKERGIKDYKNNIDIILNKRGLVRNGDKTGYIIYANGFREELYYGA